MVKIILIGGTAGTGKSTIARKIASKININHVIGTGFIREILNRELDTDGFSHHTYEDVPNFTPYEFLVHQTMLMKNAIEACINRAYKEGTWIIMEGNHCIPWIINNLHVTNNFIMYVTDTNLHKKMINTETHKKRMVTDEEFERIIDIQRILVKMANKYNIPVIEQEKAFEKIMEQL